MLSPSALPTKGCAGYTFTPLGRFVVIEELSCTYCNCVVSLTTYASNSEISFSAISPSNYCYQRVTIWHHCTAHFQTITKTCQTTQNLSVGRIMQIFTLYINIYKNILNLGVSTNLKFGHISS